MRSALAARMYAAVQLSSQQQQMYVKRIVKKMQLIIYQRFIIRMNIRGKVRRCLQLVRPLSKKKTRSAFGGWDGCCALHSHYFLYFFSEVFPLIFFIIRLRHLHNRTTNFEVEKKVFLSREFFRSLISRWDKKRKNSKAFNRWTSDESGATFLVFCRVNFFVNFIFLYEHTQCGVELCVCMRVSILTTISIVKS